MIFAAAGYAYPNAKVRALRSRRLTAQDRHFLLEARDFSSFLAYLVTTPYGRVLPDLEEEKTDPGVLERRLARSPKIGSRQSWPSWETSASFI